MLLHALRLAALARAAAQYYAVASMQGSGNYDVSGFVKFEQSDAQATCADGSTSSCSDVTVTFSMTGLTDGEHGFHVHQYGDTRATDDLSTMATHFVPFCNPPEIDPDTGETVGGCENDQVCA